MIESLKKIPEVSLEYLGLQKNSRIIILGCLNYFELWTPEDFAKYRPIMQNQHGLLEEVA